MNQSRARLNHIWSGLVCFVLFRTALASTVGDTTFDTTVLTTTEAVDGTVTELAVGTTAEPAVYSTVTTPQQQQPVACRHTTNSTQHQPAAFRVNVQFPAVELAWRRPACVGHIRRYALTVTELPRLSTVVRCSQDQCRHRFTGDQCQFCFSNNSSSSSNNSGTYTFRVAAIFQGEQLQPDAHTEARVAIDACHHLPHVPNADTVCDGMSTVRSSSTTASDDVLQDGAAADTEVNHHIQSVYWQLGTRCRVQCHAGFAFRQQPPVSGYVCSRGRRWLPPVEPVQCVPTVAVERANLRYRLHYSYTGSAIARLEYQFEGLVRKYSDIFCAGPDDQCRIASLQYVPLTIATISTYNNPNTSTTTTSPFLTTTNSSSSNNNTSTTTNLTTITSSNSSSSSSRNKRSGNSSSDPVESEAGVEVVLTLDPPLHQLEDQLLLLETAEHVLSSVDTDNAFMTLIDYHNIRLLLPQRNQQLQKAAVEFCCHHCPIGFAYRLGKCLKE